MAQGPHLDTDEEVGLLCSNSWSDLLAYKYKTYTPKLGTGINPLVDGEDSSTDFIFWAT